MADGRAPRRGSGRLGGDLRLAGLDHGVGQDRGEVEEPFSAGRGGLVAGDLDQAGGEGAVAVRGWGADGVERSVQGCGARGVGGWSRRSDGWVGFGGWDASRGER
jgi:hypothetical protein